MRVLLVMGLLLKSLVLAAIPETSLIEISEKNGTILLSDGSFWHVAKADLKTVLDWKEHDLITLKPQSLSFFFDNFEIKMVHTASGSCASVTCAESTLPSSGLWLFNVDKENGKCILSDGSCWTLFDEKESFEKWQKEDRVAIGFESSIFLKERYFLINITQNSYRAVKMYEEE